jgi:fructose-1,6-bisphosphatase
MASEEMDEPYGIPETVSARPYLLIFDPLDGSSNSDVNVSVGTIFSVLRARGRPQATPRRLPAARHPQVAAGYAIYGPATMLVLTVGKGTHGFTLDRERAIHPDPPDIRVPEDTSEFAINTSNERFWEPPVQRYVTNAWPARPACAARLQHALDRLDGRRGAPHPDARRHLHVPEGQQGPEQARPPAPDVRGQPDRPC